jgi:hypothetical protein
VALGNWRNWRLGHRVQETDVVSGGGEDGVDAWRISRVILGVTRRCVD